MRKADPLNESLQQISNFFFSWQELLQNQERSDCSQREEHYVNQATTPQRAVASLLLLYLRRYLKLLFGCVLSRAMKSAEAPDAISAFLRDVG